MNTAMRSRLLLFGPLAGLGAWSIGLALFSSAFTYDRDVLDQPVLAFVLLQSAAGMVYLLSLWRLKKADSSRRLVLMLFATGLAMRLTQFTATPILEDDYYRYLWDGAVSAHAINPYSHAPDAVRWHHTEVPEGVQHMGDDSGGGGGDEGAVVLERINHPALRTIYPPTAQVMFAIAHGIKPFDIQGLRWTWLGLDLVIAMLLLILLRGRASAAWQFAIYWLNPLLIKEVFNSGHMELIVIAALLATLVAMMFRRGLLAGFMLGLAVGAKIWPTLWAPLLLRHVSGSLKYRVSVVAVLIATAAILLMPLLASRLDGTSGLAAYAERWQMNDSAFMVIHGTAKLLFESHAQVIARTIVGLIVVGVLIVRLRSYTASSDFPDWLTTSVLVVTAALFLLSPTQYPWYFLWVLPLLALRPAPSLLALTVTLPMYYLRFPLKALGHAAWFDYGLVWIEFGPIWLMLGIDLWRSRRRSNLVEQTEAPTCSMINA